MLKIRTLLENLSGDSKGTMAIETAFVAPLLIFLSIGSFQVSTMVARQSELQSAAAEAAAIALAKPPESHNDLTVVRDIMKSSTGLTNSDVTVSLKYRCGSATARVDSPGTCASSDPVWTYMRIQLTDTYVPIWTRLGIGSNVELAVDRAVQIS